MVLPTDTLFSCIASSSADWDFGVARLISSASMRLAKMGLYWKSKYFVPSSVSRTTFVPMRSPGIRSGVNWIRLNFRFSTLRERVHDLGFPETGDPLEQHVSSRQQARHDAADDFDVADDDAGHLVLNSIVLFVELADFFLNRDHGSGVDSAELVRMDKK